MKIWLNQIACRENLNKDPIIMWVTQHSQYEVGYSSPVACKAQIQPILANDTGQRSWLKILANDPGLRSWPTILANDPDQLSSKF